MRCSPCILPLGAQRVEASLAAQQRYKERVASFSELYGEDGRADVLMIHGDLLAEGGKGELSDGDWTDGDIVFANSTCFSRDLMNSIAVKAGKLKSGSIIITLTQQLNNPELKMFKERQFAMSWGPATAYFHVRI